MKDEAKTEVKKDQQPQGFPEGLFSNPEMLQKIVGMVQSMTAPSQSPTTEPNPEPSKAQPSATPSGLGIDGLASVLSNPALMESLPQIIAVMKPILASMPKQEPSKLPKQSGSMEDCRNNLLLALKPFLSPERCDAVDSIIRISRLGTVFQQLK